MTSTSPSRPFPSSSSPPSLNFVECTVGVGGKVFFPRCPYLHLHKTGLFLFRPSSFIGSRAPPREIFSNSHPDADILKRPFVRSHSLASLPFLCVFSSPKGSLFMHPPPFSWGAKAEGRIEGHKKEDKKNRAECVTGSVRDFFPIALNLYP